MKKTTKNDAPRRVRTEKPKPPARNRRESKPVDHKPREELRDDVRVTLTAKGAAATKPVIRAARPGADIHIEPMMDGVKRRNRWLLAAIVAVILLAIGLRLVLERHAEAAELPANMPASMDEVQAILGACQHHYNRECMIVADPVPTYP